MIVDIYTHILPDRFFQEMSRISPKLENIGARLRGVKKLFDLDLRFADPFTRYVGSVVELERQEHFESPPLVAHRSPFQARRI